jgi:Spy/CpxP family protein refolding chaperone
MKETFSRLYWNMTLLGLGLAISAGSSAVAQSGVAALPPPQEPGAQQPGPPQDPIAQLNLTPEQRQQIRTIREQNKEERAQINRRVRETQIALDQALDSDNPNEALIEQRAREAGEAQAAAIKLRALTQIRIRRVLTPEQIKTLRLLQLQAQEQKREQRLENRANERPARGLRNQRNTILPQRRDNLLRRPRP